MDTEFIKKPAVRYGNKLAHGLSASALVFLYATFATKHEVARLDARCDRCEEKRAAQWRRLMDHEVALARSGVNVVSADWKENKP